MHVLVVNSFVLVLEPRAILDGSAAGGVECSGRRTRQARRDNDIIVGGVGQTSHSAHGHTFIQALQEWDSRGRTRLADVAGLKREIGAEVASTDGLVVEHVQKSDTGERKALGHLDANATGANDGDAQLAEALDKFGAVSVEHSVGRRYDFKKGVVFLRGGAQNACLESAFLSKSFGSATAVSG